MRRIIFGLTILLASPVLYGQVQDTVSTAQPAQVQSTVEIIPQQEEVVPTADSASMINEAKTEVVEPSTTQGNEPKIIYYQTTPEKNYESRNYSYRNRSERRGDIKTLAGSMNHSGGFGALSFRTTEFNNETMVIAGVRAGWIINRTVGIGVEGHGIIPTTKYEGIDITQDVFAVGGYGGMFLEMILFSNTVVHVTFPTSAGAGWIGYNQDWENNPPSQPGSSTTYESALIDEDIFWYVEPGANLELNISRNFRMDFGVSRRFTQDLELINTPRRSFEDLNYYVTLKIGGF